MKSKLRLIQVVIIAFIFTISLSCQKQKTGWQGIIEEENGIRVVKNPAEPLYGELVLELEEDLSIGSVEDEKYMFYRIGDIAVDSQNNIYVLDGGNYRIQKFDKDGNYLQTIGRKGQGPGEFMMPFNIFLDELDNIYVME
ncbi:MAG: 6-bladed beta-propeller, partial [Candidatus Aminicenantes bacterium]